MFKKLKDKLAEEVKSSPQRIQQFAQAAQAAVTSASSSISDITNSDLFSIADNDNQQNIRKDPFENVSLVQPKQSQTTSQYRDVPGPDYSETQRQRRLSNSSLASDVSFRLPNYESPSMYHLQSDMEVSASEAEERGFSAGSVNLDRVTKEQLYAVYKRTQERYSKYRTQYGDLARHYKLLEKENAKAKSVLVETQDKALRRISELREQCTLEQSAKAHLERALRVEIEEKNMKIEALSTKVNLLQQMDNNTDNANNLLDSEHDKQLIDLSSESDKASEINLLNNKIESMEQLINKYKESLKTNKEKYAEISAENKILTADIQTKNKEIDELKSNVILLNEAKTKINELNEINETLQNKINSYEFSKVKEKSSLDLELEKAQEEISELRKKNELFNKKEEEYAISLAENKLSIHKELESKENIIKSLNNNLTASHKELQSINIIVNEYKQRLAALEDEKCNLKKEITEYESNKKQILQMTLEINDLSQKCLSLEQSKSKIIEENKCLQLQMKQETAEKLAMVDRNNYLNEKNDHLSDELERKNVYITTLENEMQILKNDNVLKESEVHLETQVLHEKDEEINIWKSKCQHLQSEIQEEKEELTKLQTEIENLLKNHELIQTENLELRNILSSVKTEKKDKYKKNIQLIGNCNKMLHNVKEFKQAIVLISSEMKSFQKLHNELTNLKDKTCLLITNNEKLYEDLNRTKLENKNLKEKINNSDSGNKIIQNEIENISEKYQKCLIELQEMSVIKENLQKCKNDYLENEKKLHDNKTTEMDLHKKLEDLKIQNKNLVVELKNQESENNHLKEQIERINREYNTCIDKIEQTKKTIVDFENLQMKCNDYIKELELLKNNNQSVIGLNNDLKKENDDLNIKHRNSELENVALTEKISSIRKDYEACLNDLKLLEDLKLQFDKVQSEYQNTQLELENIKQSHCAIVNEIDKLKQENNSLKMHSQEIELQKNSLSEKSQHFNNLYEATLNDLNHYKTSNQDLADKLKDLEENVKSHSEKNRNDCLHIENLEKDNKSLHSRITNLEERESHVNKELNQLKIGYEDKVSEVASLKNKNSNLLNYTKDFDEKVKYISDLELNNKNLTEDNSNLKEQTDLANKTIEELKIELKKIKETIINTEQNNHQSSTLPILENDKKCQMSLVHDENSCDQYKELLDLKNEHDFIKDENKRLKSDIEGLQAYLRKISKENSLLNDKLRDFIASSDNNPDKTDTMSQDLTNLKDEIQSGKEKIENLLRENTFLVEENLELKDQLQSENSYVSNKTKATDNEEFRSLKDQYSKLLQVKNNLEKKLSDLELMNTSDTQNIQLMHENNEKLKHSNEKLGRRLDEALVSLRHLHSLQESTELEYLKNILYEYLTGSGMHSLTLAKVLAAVVKFDEKQTQIVLQKEKERQGLLRQLGLT